MTKPMKYVAGLSVIACAALMGCEASPDGTWKLQSAGVVEEAIINGRSCAASEYPTAVAIITDATIVMPGMGTQDVVQISCTGR